jgi:CheY-like chemotaxis protein
VYATLTRLASSGLIEGAGVSVEQLPLYQLSSPGKAAAESWLCAESDVDVSDWSEVLDVVLLSLTLPEIDTQDTCDGIRQKLDKWAAPAAANAEVQGPLPSLVHESRNRHATAVTTWLDDVSNASAEAPDVSRGFTADRPRRGRRPNLVQ